MKKHGLNENMEMMQTDINATPSPEVKSAYVSFSEVEDSIDAFDRIKAITVMAGNRAAIAAKKAGLSRAYIIRKNQIINLSSKGMESRVEPIIKRQSYYVDFKPGTIFHARKK